MSSRAEQLLQTAATQEALIGSLERGDTIFVLSSGTLLYQDSSGTRRVTLRDLTRIHSDQDGLLRVETPAGTALTASLLGFDPVDVQTFFGQVRDTTARVKQAGSSAAVLPAAPPAPARPAGAASGPLSSGGKGVVGASDENSSGDFHESVKVVSAPKEPTLIIPAAASGSASANASASARTPTAATTAVPESRNPTLITASPTSQRAESSLTPPPTPPRNPALVASPQASPALPITAPPSQRAPEQPSPVTYASLATPEAAAHQSAAPAPDLASSSPLKDSPQESTGASQSGAQAQDPALAGATQAARAPHLPQSAAGALAALAAHAGGVRAWVGRLRFLAVLTLLAAFALAFFQLRGGQQLAGIWVLIAGGVSAVGLLALADLTKLLTLLANAVSAEGGVIDVD